MSLQPVGSAGYPSEVMGALAGSLRTGELRDDEGEGDDESFRSRNLLWPIFVTSSPRALRMPFTSSTLPSRAAFRFSRNSMDYATRWASNWSHTLNDVTTKPRDIRQLASECSQIMAGVYYVVTLAT